MNLQRILAKTFASLPGNLIVKMAGGAPMGTLIPVPGTWRDRFAPY